MREIIQVEEFSVRGRQVLDKIKSIIKSGRAREIVVEDKQGSTILRILPDDGFVSQTLNILKGTIKVIKSCKLIVTNKQMPLFGLNKQLPLFG